MTRLWFPLLLIGCYTPPDLPITPWADGVLVSEEGDPTFVCAPERIARVSCTIDGDTSDIVACGDGGERLRLLGIDAPETEKPGTEAECFADLATAELSRLIDGRVVTLSFDRQCTDAFTRTLAYIWLDLDDAQDVLPDDVIEELLTLRSDSLSDTGAANQRILVNEYMLLKGFVRRFDEEWVEPLRWEPELVAAERLAQVRREGLWSACE